jgi:hypothetical protein
MSEEKIKGQGPIDLVTDKDKQRIEKTKDLADRRNDDSRALMKIAAFRRFLNEVLEDAKVHNGIFVAGDNGYTTAYNSGRQDLGLTIMKRFLIATPEAYIQMCNEARAEKIQIDKELNKPKEN